MNSSFARVRKYVQYMIVQTRPSFFMSWSQPELTNSTYSTLDAVGAVLKFRQENLNFILNMSADEFKKLNKLLSFILIYITLQ